MTTVTKAVTVVLGTYNFSPDTIEQMVVKAIQVSKYPKLNHMRVIVDGSPVLKSWANRQLDVEGSAVSIYQSSHYGGNPVARNNAAIKGDTSHKGKAHLIIQLGMVPPHNPEKEQSSTQETLLEWWSRQKQAPQMVQVWLDEDGNAQGCVRKPGDAWYKYRLGVDAQGGTVGKKHPMEKLVAPPKRNNTSKLAERSAAF